MSATSNRRRHLCTNPECDAGLGGKPKRVYGRKRRCRVCRMIDAVKRTARNHRKREPSTVSVSAP